jgi:hypothetical protein
MPKKAESQIRQPSITWAVAFQTKPANSLDEEERTTIKPLKSKESK